MQKIRLRYLVIWAAALICMCLSVYVDAVLHGKVGGPIIVNEWLLEAAENFYRELSFALVIAWIISVGIETHAREEDGKRAERLRKSIAEDVFKGVFTHRLPRVYVDRVAEIHLYPPVIREEIKMALLLRNTSSEELEGWSLQANKFSVLETRISYTLKNTSTGLHHHEVSIMIPFRAEQAPSAAQFLNVRMNGRNLSAEEVQLALVNSENAIYFRKEILMEAGESYEVAAHTQVLKEISDNDLWACFLPTMETTFEIDNQLGGGITGLRYTGGEIEPSTVSANGQSKTWIIRSPVLKGESMLCWWRY